MVLILIVVEYGLGEALSNTIPSFITCLNPYCSGIWSRRSKSMKTVKTTMVLILIVVEYGLGGL